MHFVILVTDRPISYDSGSSLCEFRDFSIFIIVLDFFYMDSMSLSWIAMISSYAKLFFTVIHEI